MLAAGRGDAGGARVEAHPAPVPAEGVNGAADLGGELARGHPAGHEAGPRGSGHVHAEAVGGASGGGALGLKRLGGGLPFGSAGLCSLLCRDVAAPVGGGAARQAEALPCAMQAGRGDPERRRERVEGLERVGQIGAVGLSRGGAAEFLAGPHRDSGPPSAEAPGRRWVGSGGEGGGGHSAGADKAPGGVGASTGVHVLVADHVHPAGLVGGAVGLAVTGPLVGVDVLAGHLDLFEHEVIGDGDLEAVLTVGGAGGLVGVQQTRAVVRGPVGVVAGVDEDHGRLRCGLVAPRW